MCAFVMMKKIKQIKAARGFMINSLNFNKLKGKIIKLSNEALRKSKKNPRNFPRVD